MKHSVTTGFVKNLFRKTYFTKCQPFFIFNAHFLFGLKQLVQYIYILLLPVKMLQLQIFSSVKKIKCTFIHDYDEE